MTELLASLPWDKILEGLGFTVGLLYLWWEYHADPRLWIASIVMPSISMWIYLGKGIYADFAINIYYFVIAIYGYVAWTRKQRGHSAQNEDKKSSGLPIRHIPREILAMCGAVFLLLWAGMYLALDNLTDSTVPMADSFTTSLSIVAMWILARKYIEQWLAWIAVDIVSSGLYVYKELYFYAVLYAIYTVIAVVGYRKWQRLMAKQ